MPLKAVQELLGHATIEMTMRYSHLAPVVKRDAVATLDNVTEFSKPSANTAETACNHLKSL